MNRQIKKKSIDSICDNYLRYLYRLERKEKALEGLPEILNKKRIFYDPDIINSVIKKLVSLEYIEKTEDICTFFYGLKGYKIGLFKNKSPKRSLHEEILSDDFLNNIEGRINCYKLTRKGRSFIQNDQFLNEEILANKKKWREKFIEKIIDNIFVIIITIITSVITILITVYLTKNK